MIGFDLCGNVLTLDKRGAEEDESIGRAGNVVLRFLSGVGLAFGSRDFACRGEEDRLGGGINQRGRGIRGEIDGSYIGHEGQSRGGHRLLVNKRSPQVFISYITTEQREKERER